jgi:hypothetical protein
LSEYFSAANSMRLIPPWQPGDERSPAERAKHQKARQTYVKLQQASSEYYKDPMLRASQQKYARAYRQGDVTEMKRVETEQRVLGERLIKKRHESIRAEGVDKVDLQLIELYAQLPRINGTNYDVYRKALTGLAPRLGELRCDQPDNSARFAAKSGTVSRATLLLTFHWLTFDQLGDGLPAMVEWLCSKGCVDFKYDLRQGFGFDTEGVTAE